MKIINAGGIIGRGDKKMSQVEDQQYNKMIKTPVWKLVLTLSVPTTISMLITNIYNMGDTYFVSKISVNLRKFLKKSFYFKKTLYICSPKPRSPDGEIGRHATLRGWCRLRCASSSLVLGTRKKV